MNTIYFMAQDSFNLPSIMVPSLIPPSAGYEGVAQQFEFDAEVMVTAARIRLCAQNPGSTTFLSDLVASDNLNLKDYIESLQSAYDTRRNQWPISQNAYRVSQREVAYLNQEQMQTSFLGTNNLQQCVAVIIDGTDKGGQPFLALAHVDRYTEQSSLDQVFDKFNAGKVILYGARDEQGLAAVSQDNVTMVDAALVSAARRGFQCTLPVNRRLGSSLTPSADIIYNHKLSHGADIFVGAYPDKDAQYSRTFQQVRWAHDAMQGYNPSAAVVNHGDRNASLAVKNYIAETALPRETALYLLDNYSEHGLHAKLVTLNNSTPQKVAGSTSRSEFATREFIPHINAIQRAFKQFGNEVDVKDIYESKQPIKNLARQVAEMARKPAPVTTATIDAIQNAPNPAATMQHSLEAAAQNVSSPLRRSPTLGLSNVSSPLRRSPTLGLSRPSSPGFLA